MCKQKFDFSFEEEDTIEGMKKLIVEEVAQFRQEVRGQVPRGTGPKPSNSCVLFHSPHTSTDLLHLIRLPIPSRETVASSPVTEYAAPNGATSNYTRPHEMRPGSPVMEDPSVELEKELAGTHLHQ